MKNTLVFRSLRLIQCENRQQPVKSLLAQSAKVVQFLKLTARKSSKCCCKDIHFNALLQDFLTTCPFSESIEWFIEDQAFSPPYPPPPLHTPLPSVREMCKGEIKWAKSYVDEKACSSIKCSILSVRFHGHLPSKHKQEKTVGDLGGHKSGCKTVIRTFFYSLH